MTMRPNAKQINNEHKPQALVRPSERKWRPPVRLKLQDMKQDMKINNNATHCYKSPEIEITKAHRVITTSKDKQDKRKKKKNLGAQ